MKKTLLITIALFGFMLNLLCLNAQWEVTNFPSGISIKVLTISGNNIFAGTYYYGIYLSTNNGNNWTEVNNGLPINTTVHTIANKENSIFIGTATGIYLSTNNGNNWTKVSSIINVQVIAIINNNIIVGISDGVGTTGSIYLSTDDGITWIEKNNGLDGRGVRTIAIYENNIFAGTYMFDGTSDFGDIFLSTDNGNTWIEKNNGLSGTGIRTLTVSGNNIFAGTGYIGIIPLGGLFLSTDNGNSWILKKSSTVSSIVINGNNIFTGGEYGGGIFLSTDNGNSWIDKGKPDYYTDIYLVICGEFIFAGTGAGIYRAKISDLITSVDDVKQSEFALSIAPNPIDDRTAISFNLKEANFVSVQITDLPGNVISDLIIDKFIEAGEQKIEFDSKNLTSGTYFCIIKAGKYTETVKFVVQK